MQIRERYVTFETAKLLFEKGFMWQRFTFDKTVKSEGWKDHKVSPWIGHMEGDIIPPFFNTCYNEDGKEITPKYYNPNNKHYPRPTQAMAVEWILIKYNIFIQVEWEFNTSKADKMATKQMYYATAIKISLREKENLTYEDDPYKTLEIGIQETLKLLI